MIKNFCLTGAGELEKKNPQRDIKTKPKTFLIGRGLSHMTISQPKSYLQTDWVSKIRRGCEK